MLVHLSDCLQTGFRLVSDWHKEFHIASSDFILLQISPDSFQTGSLKNGISDWQSEKIIFQTGSLKIKSFQTVI